MANSCSFSTLRVGYRFSPTHRELFESYLLKKVLGRELCCDVIREFDVFKHDPDQIPQSEFVHGSGNKAYFFTVDEGQDYSGERLRRRTLTGYWENCGEEVTVPLFPEITGVMKDSFFYRGKGPEGEKTIWRMTEYRIKFGEVYDHSLLTGKFMNRYIICNIWLNADEEEYSETKSIGETDEFSDETEDD